MIKYLLPQRLRDWCSDNSDMLIVFAIAGALFAAGFLLGWLF